MLTNAQRWRKEQEEKKVATPPAKRVFQELAMEALGRNMLCSSDRDAVRHALRKGDPIPERSLPGRMVMKLDPRKRELLRDLKPEMTEGDESWISSYRHLMM